MLSKNYMCYNDYLNRLTTDPKFLYTTDTTNFSVATVTLGIRQWLGLKLKRKKCSLVSV